MPKRSIYFADEIESVININPDQTPESFSGRVGFLIQSAALTASEQCPALPVNVWCALADANNGTWHTYEHGAPAVVSGMSLNLLDADCQFDIDPQEWGLKIRKMSFAEQFAIFEVVRRFWLDKEIFESCKDYAEVFRKLGGKVAD